MGPTIAAIAQMGVTKKTQSCHILSHGYGSAVYICNVQSQPTLGSITTHTKNEYSACTYVHTLWG